MPERTQPDPPHGRPHATPMAAPYLEFDLRREQQRLRDERDQQNGHTARTLVKYDDLRLVLIAIRADAQIPDHRTEGRIVIQALDGHLRVRAEGRTFDLRAGSVLTLDRGLPHGVSALEDSTFLLTIAWPRPAAGAA